MAESRVENDSFGMLSAPQRRYGARYDDRRWDQYCTDLYVVCNDILRVPKFKRVKKLRGFPGGRYSRHVFLTTKISKSHDAIIHGKRHFRNGNIGVLPTVGNRPMR